MIRAMCDARSIRLRWFAAALASSLAVLGIAGCGAAASKPDEEAARNTVACDVAGERVVVRFEQGEARLLMPGGERVNLYQVPSASGMRYTNGNMDLYGKGNDMRLARDGGAPVPMAGCAPLVLPK